MAQTNFTPILTYKSDTATSVPSAGNLTNSTNGAELAVNTADKRLFTKDSGGNVVEVGTNPSSLTLPNSTANGVLYSNGSKVVTSGSALTFDGTNFATTGSGTLKNLLLSGGTLPAAGNPSIALRSSDNVIYHQSGSANTIVLLDSSQNTMQSIGATVQSWNISNAEQMRLTSTGLGIGTSSPATKIDARLSGTSSGTVINVGNTGTGIFGGVGVSDGGAYPVELWGSALSFKTGSSTYASATEKMRLDSSGNLGLGVTPSAYGSGAKAFEVNASSTYWGYASGGIYITGMSNNTYGAGSTNRYKNTATAGEYSITGNVHAWHTAPSGTAGNAITFSQVMTLDASGNLLVGTTSGFSTAGGRGNISVNGSSTSIVAIGAGGSRKGYLFTDGTNATLGADSALVFDANGAERARIDSSGNLLVNTTSVIQGGTICSSFAGDTRNGVVLQTTFASAGTAFIRFVNSAGTSQGEINATTTSVVAYLTTSDYRLKNTIAPMTGALAKVAQLKPVTYKWNSDGSNGQGFIAHELAEVVPECVSGEKDGLDKDGNPKYQGIDTSFLVATLTAAIQELKAEFDAYKASHP